MLIGYARVSTPTQNLGRQVRALREAGCERIFEETASGASLRGRPQLSAAIRMLAEGDTLILAEWDRATRSLIDGVQIITRVADRGATIKALDKPWADLTTPMGQGLLGLLSAMAQDERERIARRAAEGRTLAKARGVKFGRPSKLGRTQRVEVHRLLDQGWEDAEIARLVGVHRTTIGRIRREREAQASG